MIEINRILWDLLIRIPFFDKIHEYIYKAVQKMSITFCNKRIFIPASYKEHAVSQTAVYIANNFFSILLS